MLRKASLALRSIIKTNKAMDSIVPTSVRSITNSKQARTNAYGSDQTTVNDNEMRKFERLSKSWWQENGPFEALHRFNALRVPWINRTIGNNYMKSVAINPTEPLDGIYVLDIGCGGGILSEPLARLGAQVTAIDMVRQNIVIAQNRLNSFVKGTNDFKIVDRIQYINCTLEDLAVSDQNTEFFDAIIMSEVVEHVDNLDLLIENASKLLKNDGFLFVTTLNRTYASYVLAILAAENVLGIVEKGTHDWKKFVEPHHLKSLLEKNNLVTESIEGITYNPITRNWSWIPTSQVNYALYARKRLAKPRVDL